MKQFLAAIVLLFSTTLWGQGISFSTEVDSTELLIGEQAILTLRAEIPEGTDFIWPLIPDTITGLEIIDLGIIDTVTQKGKMSLQQEVRITSFDSGYVTLPPLALVVNGDSTLSLALGIGVGMPETNEEQDFYDIKAPLEPPFDWGPFIPWIIGGAAGLALLGFGIFYFIKSRNKEEVPIEETLPPAEWARQQLMQLNQEQLWQKGENKAYYSRLTDVLRTYLSRQMNIHALESTADEIIEELTKVGIPQELFTQMKTMLQLSDMAKFAKQKPNAFQNEESIKTVYEFIAATEPKEEKKEGDDVSV